jgi:zinc ribbon protein
MSYCPKCGNKVDETMTFCPNCGASLKAAATTQGGAAEPEYRYRHYRHHEKHDEKAEKHGEKHEKAGGGYGFLIAGVLIVLLGLLGYINATTNVFSSLNGPMASALVLVAIGIVILVAGLYYYSRSRRRNPVPT